MTRKLQSLLQEFNFSTGESEVDERLVVLDDVWIAEHVHPFEDALGGTATLLLTTRNARLAHDFGDNGGGTGSTIVPVSQMDEIQALCLLSNYLGRDVTSDFSARALVQQCYCLPIAVRAAAAMVKRGTPLVPKDDLNTAHEYLKREERRM